MNSTFLVCLVLIALSARSASSSKQCEDDSWYDALTGLCRGCDVCGKKSLELEPCTQFKNTICVDLSLFKFDLKPKPQKWHEMETMDSENMQVEVKDVTPDKKVPSAPSKVEWYSVWDIGVFVGLCLALLSVVLAIVVLLFKQPSRFFSWNGSGKKSSRFRLFSRDRLSTTEYMNNLATLDRRLAMDEILEKRKKAIFDSQLLPENVYSDEVFVDISGFPYHIYEDLRFGDNDQGPTNSLLRPDRQPNA